MKQEHDYSGALAMLFNCSTPEGYAAFAQEYEETIRAALTTAKGGNIKWEDAETWHDDDGLCLFIFFVKENNEYYDMLFTSPASSDWPEEEGLFGYFTRIDTSAIVLPPLKKQCAFCEGDGVVCAGMGLDDKPEFTDCPKCRKPPQDGGDDE